MWAIGVSHSCILFFGTCHVSNMSWSFFFSSHSSRTTKTKKKEPIGWPLEYWPQNWSQKLGVHPMKNKHSTSLLTLIVSFPCVFSEEKPRKKLPWREGQAPSHSWGGLCTTGLKASPACCGINARGQCLSVPITACAEGRQDHLPAHTASMTQQQIFLQKIRERRKSKKVNERRSSHYGAVGEASDCRRHGSEPLALCSVLKDPCCCSFCVDHSCGSDFIPGPGTSIGCECGHKKKSRWEKT